MPEGDQNRFLGCRSLSYADGSGSPLIRPSITPNSRRPIRDLDSSSGALRGGYEKPLMPSCSYRGVRSSGPFPLRWLDAVQASRPWPQWAF
jgi:hypothetical protein